MNRNGEHRAVNAVHLTASRFFGGPERQMLGLAQALPAGYRCAFLSFAEDGHSNDFLGRVRHAGFPAGALRNDSPHFLSAVAELTVRLRQWNAGILFSHGYKADALGLWAARRIGIPIVSVSRGWTAESLRVRTYEMLDRRLLRWMDRVVCVSHGQAAKVRGTGVPEEKIVVIRNAIQTTRFDSPNREYSERLRRLFPRRPRLIIGAAGRLSPEKGFGILVAAAAEVVRTEPEIAFVLFGDGCLRQKLEEQVAALGLKDRLVLAGHCDELDDYLPFLDVVVLPSFTEGLPNIALEASAAGVPVVATAVGGTPEVIVDGSTGLLVPPGDPHAMAQAINNLLASESRRRALGEQGRQRVRVEFSFAKQAEQYRRLFETLGIRSDRKVGLNAREPGCDDETAAELSLIPVLPSE